MPLKLCTFSTLYPNKYQPQHGVFVEQRLRQLLYYARSTRIASRVVAPVPWFPIKGSVFGRYGDYAKVGRLERRYGIEVIHPRYPVIPKVGMAMAPWLLATGARPALAKLTRGGFDIIDAHYFYPDGVAAVMLGRRIGKPVTVTVRGSDLNRMGEYAVPRRLMTMAARRASGLITVSKALKDKLVSWGIGQERILVLRNGVDLDLFRPLDREAVRKDLGLSSTVLLYVGRLARLKGVDIVVRSLSHLHSAHLVLVGAGREEQMLKVLARRLNVMDRVTFVGPLPQEQLPRYYAAADVLVLVSSNEGCPNVLLESLACGTPVVATRVGGVPEIVTSHEAGRLMEERTSDALVKAIRQLLKDYPDRRATRRFAEKFSWTETSRGQLHLFNSILSRPIES